MNLWWAEGLRFSCVACGRCCRGEPGAIYFTPSEGAAISEFLTLSPEAFRRRYTTLRWGDISIRERENGECLFYCSTSNRCAIYPVRPEQCRSFPFWPSILESKACWDEAARSCPGMNRGDLHSPEEIDRIVRSCPFPDLL